MSPFISRRSFVGAVAAAAASVPLARARAFFAGEKRPRRILLRSSWQTVNIGDIAHTPGVLKLLDEHHPTAEVTLWPSSVDNGVDAILRKRFPKLKIATTAAQKATAIQECDFLLHGSGPSVVGRKELARWQAETDKPYGIYGVTISDVDEELKKILNGAKFVYCRDSVSLASIKSKGVAAPIMEFSPDGAFACDLADDAAADAFLKRNDLTPGKFLCCIPRLRYTPYWLIASKKQPLNSQKNARNEEMAEHDHAPLRAAIEAVIRETDFKVLVCPEDQTQMKVGKDWIVDRLPSDVRARVVWRDRYWLTGEALSTYRRSGGLFGLEMHSPIMSIGQGVPALVGRFAEQTTKGLMWRDIGLGDWLFDFDKPEDIARLTPTVLALAKDPAAAKAKAAAGRATVEKRFAETMGVLGNYI
jgi:polysaccharide pyruvyl transferase WcaK-like protein